ncbi:helix-turn-helix domain-containing protein [Candidatus Pelagibacter sp.]|jgi:L-glutamine-phosphate cytidylyltransferase|nr:helix-turn-helix domain-containing protein [Candidatus Pelagibacter sp.]
MKKNFYFSETFGSYIRKQRIKHEIGQRELAKLIGVAPSYLNDIEKNKRTAPRIELIKKLSLKLKADLDLLYDLAGKSKKTVAPDILDYIEKNSKISSLLRSIKSNNLSNNEIDELEKQINETETKVLIIAAGLGSRLKNHTENLPKCMLDFGGKTLLQRQLDSYKECGIKDISLIRGYKKEKINYKKINYFENTDYKNNNILNSIFYAEEVINGNLIISYSDILFDPSVVQRTLDSDHDISVVVDIDWRGYYVGRKDHPISEAENVIFNSNNEVKKIGKINKGNEDVHGEFIGMIKLSNRGTEIFKQHFNRLKKIYWNKPFQRAKIFQKAYLTDFIQELVDIGIKVHCIIIESGWKEIDTVEDYKKALAGFNKKFTKN